MYFVFLLWQLKKKKNQLLLTDRGCTPTQFKCISDGTCIEDIYRCDRRSDCEDRSDEDNCDNETTKNNTINHNNNSHTSTLICLANFAIYI